MAENRPTVLLIDDDDSLRRVTEYTLHEAGYRVLTAADGEAGLRIFDLETPPVVVTDIQMPKSTVTTSSGGSRERIRKRWSSSLPPTARWSGRSRR